MREFDYKKEKDFDGEEGVYSQSVRAGRRTYFFDVKATKNEDYYLSITESRKKQNSEGNTIFEKHKIYLYKEDFARFEKGLKDVISFIKKEKPDFFKRENSEVEDSIGNMESTSRSATDIEFESL